MRAKMAMLQTYKAEDIVFFGRDPRKPLAESITQDTGRLYKEAGVRGRVCTIYPLWVGDKLVGYFEDLPKILKNLQEYLDGNMQPQDGSSGFQRLPQDPLAQFFAHSNKILLEDGSVENDTNPHAFVLADVVRVTGEEQKIIAPIGKPSHTFYRVEYMKSGYWEEGGFIEYPENLLNEVIHGSSAPDSLPFIGGSALIQGNVLMDAACRIEGHAVVRTENELKLSGVRAGGHAAIAASGAISSAAFSGSALCELSLTSALADVTAGDKSRLTGRGLTARGLRLGEDAAFETPGSSSVDGLTVSDGASVSVSGTASFSHTTVKAHLTVPEGITAEFGAETIAADATLSENRIADHTETLTLTDGTEYTFRLHGHVSAKLFGRWFCSVEVKRGNDASFTPAAWAETWDAVYRKAEECKAEPGSTFIAALIDHGSVFFADGHQDDAETPDTFRVNGFAEIRMEERRDVRGKRGEEYPLYPIWYRDKDGKLQKGGSVQFPEQYIADILAAEDSSAAADPWSDAAFLASLPRVTGSGTVIGRIVLGAGTQVADRAVVMTTRAPGKPPVLTSCRFTGKAGVSLFGGASLHSVSAENRAYLLAGQDTVLDDVALTGRARVILSGGSLRKTALSDAAEINSAKGTSLTAEGLRMTDDALISLGKGSVTVTDREIGRGEYLSGEDLTAGGNE